MKQKLRKTIVGVLATAAVLVIGSASVFAAGPGYGRNYTDSDGNGICDYASGVCSSLSSRLSQNGSGQNFTDADNDGVCDNLGSQLSQNGSGQNFTDADNNGVYDNYGTRQGQGFRGGHGRHHNR